MSESERVAKIKELIELLDRAIVLGKELNDLLDKREIAMELLTSA